MVETRTAIVTLLDQDVLRIELKPDSYLDVQELTENLQAYRLVMQTERAYLLTIAREGVEPSPEARKIFSTPERSSFKIAEAFVITSMAQRIIANVVMKLHRPPHPVKFFNSEPEARDWLYKQREKDKLKT